MRVLVTRPAAQAREWVGQLGALGIEAAALPLIGIEGPADAAAVDTAWAGLAARRLVVFVSPNAAARFFARRPAAFDWPDGVLAGSPGPGTTRALRELGVPATCLVEPAPEAPQFDSEALWAQLAARDWQGAPVLIVRGEGGREWLAETLTRHGARVETLSAYARAAPVLDAAEQARLHAALAEPAAHLWLFSSSEAIGHLAVLAPDADWSRARALATHPRIAERARALGFGRVLQAPPALDAVAACIQSSAP